MLTRYSDKTQNKHTSAQPSLQQTVAELAAGNTLSYSQEPQGPRAEPKAFAAQG